MGSGVFYALHAEGLYTGKVEAASNTSAVALRVVGGDEKESLASERVKYGRESQGTGTRERLRWRGPGAIVNDTPVDSDSV
jgi:hypothetical protein